MVKEEGKSSQTLTDKTPFNNLGKNQPHSLIVTESWELTVTLVGPLQRKNV